MPAFLDQYGDDAEYVESLIDKSADWAELLKLTEALELGERAVLQAYRKVHEQDYARQHELKIARAKMYEDFLAYTRDQAINHTRRSLFDKQVRVQVKRKAQILDDDAFAEWARTQGILTVPKYAAPKRILAAWVAEHRPELLVPDITAAKNHAIEIDGVGEAVNRDESVELVWYASEPSEKTFDNVISEISVYREWLDAQGAADDNKI